MFFDKIKQIPEIALKSGTSIFVVPDSQKINIDGAMVLSPNEKTTITIDQVRQVLSRVEMRQVGEQFILIRPADKLRVEAANALLKTLEEPGERVHFVLITDKPSRLPVTVMSRASIYFWREGMFNLEIKASDKKKDLAKRLLAARPDNIVDLAEEIAKKKDGVREYALEILGLSIEMLYKSYFLTGKDVFVRKLPGYLLAYENILRNGHVKLHLIADIIE